MANKVPTSVRFDDTTKARLIKVSERTGIPVKNLIETAMKWYVAEAERLFADGRLPVAPVVADSTITDSATPGTPAEPKPSVSDSPEPVASERGLDLARELRGGDRIGNRGKVRSTKAQ